MIHINLPAKKDVAQPGKSYLDTMPLQNRMTPVGVPIAISARGTLMGNRGGRLHDDKQRLGKRLWVSKAWICCELEFKDRHRKVWGDGYTEFFFLDEVTAFAAGHRPCFECRRKDAEHFAALFSGQKKRATAAEMDRKLHVERVNEKWQHRLPFSQLPEGAMALFEGAPCAVRGKRLLHWSPMGYWRPIPRPRGRAEVLTPPSILKVLQRGYQPRWHPTAG